MDTIGETGRATMTGRRVTRDVAIALMILVGTVAGALYVATIIDFEPDERTFTYLLAGLILGSAGLLLALFGGLVAVWRADHYDARPVSPLMLSQLVIVVTLAVYLGLLAIAAIDLFAHDGRPHWRLLREPEIVLISNLIVAGLVIGPAMYLYEVQRGRGWPRRAVLAFYLAGGTLYVLVIALAVVLGTA